MGLRSKLTLLFIALVAIPATIAAVLLVDQAEDAAREQADARLEAALHTARAVYGTAVDEAPAEARSIASAAARALAAGDRERLRVIVRRGERDPGVAAVSVTGPHGRVLAAAGPAVSIGGVRRVVPAAALGGGTVHVRISTLTTTDFIARVRELTDREAAVVTDDQVLAASLDISPDAVPDQAADGFDISTEVGERRAVALELDGAPSGTRLILLAPASAGILASEPLVAAVLIVFFLVAFVLVALLVRSMRRRISSMLAAARRMSGGEFGVRLPVDGSDEIAALAQELNRMSEQLSRQMGELKRSRNDLDGAVRRLGEAFASGLDRDSLLQILIETARLACRADAGVIIGPDWEGPGELRDGSSETRFRMALQRVGAAATEARGAEVATMTEGDVHTLALALPDRKDPERMLCTVALARAGEPFGTAEAELLTYLVGQTAVSIENIALHERVARQAITDGLTGLSNHRRFAARMEAEVARANRFGAELSVVLLDIDDFKRVNDTHGHLQGDAVLVAVGVALREEAREIDEIARWGGEEFVLALPETSRDGAVSVAERLRDLVAGLEVDGQAGGEPVRITASFGVATLPEDGRDGRSLIAAADEALYRAKQRGKDQVATTAEPVQSLAQGNPAARRS